MIYDYYVTKRWVIRNVMDRYSEQYFKLSTDGWTDERIREQLQKLTTIFLQWKVPNNIYS